jgi:hypothetical protein
MVKLGLFLLKKVPNGFFVALLANAVSDFELNKAVLV